MFSTEPFYFSRLGHVTIDAIINNLEYEQEIGIKTNDFKAVICGQEFYMITLVTPEDPAHDEFSKWLLDIMLKACIRK